VEERVKTCAKCGQIFTCGSAAGERQCWCEDLPHISSISDPTQDCFCADCLAEQIASVQTLNASANDAEAGSSPVALIEGVDYYTEGDAVVFTSTYHLRRGYCCDSGCRHCPFKQPANAT
jgi:hypothetical protein